MQTIYFVDDDGLLREMVARVLERERYRVRVFSSPQELLPHFESKPPDLLISDVQMPGMNGVELLETIRRRGHSVPVILMSAHITPEVEQEATRLGVHRLVNKPIKDFSGLTSLIRESLQGSRISTECSCMDRLRLGFLTDLSHELRTPLTAIKLALDGLFASHSSPSDSASQRLLDISQRNIDRIVGLVENQLDLLQITLGDVSISRRLVNLHDVVDGAARISTTGSSRSTGGENSPGGCGVYLFTDPDRLQGVIKHILESTSARHDASVEFQVDSSDPHEILVEFWNTGIPLELGGERSSAGPIWNVLSGDADREFEYRACRRLVELLGGSMVVSDDHGNQNVRLRLPVVPLYDRRADFVIPMKNLRKAAMLNGKTISFIRCEIAAADAGGEAQALEREFLQRSVSTLSEGDVLVRGRSEGVYYLALIARTRDETEHIVRFLKGCGAASGGTTVQLLQAVLPGESYPEDLILDLEAAK